MGVVECSTGERGISVCGDWADRVGGHAARDGAEEGSGCGGEGGVGEFLGRLFMSLLTTGSGHSDRRQRSR